MWLRENGKCQHEQFSRENKNLEISLKHRVNVGIVYQRHDIWCNFLHEISQHFLRHCAWP